MYNVTLPPACCHPSLAALPAKCGKLERGIHFNGGDLTTCPELGGTCFYARGVNTIEACCNKCADKAGW